MPELPKPAGMGSAVRMFEQYEQQVSVNRGTAGQSFPRRAAGKVDNEVGKDSSINLVIRAVSLAGVPLSQAITGYFDGRGGTIGRSDTNTLALPDPERHISRLQAEVSFIDGRYLLRNASSANALLHNERRVVPGESVVLEDGDELQIGAYVLAIEHARDSLAARTITRGRLAADTRHGTRRGNGSAPLQQVHEAADSAGAAEPVTDPARRQPMPEPASIVQAAAAAANSVQAMASASSAAVPPGRLPSRAASAVADLFGLNAPSGRTYAPGHMTGFGGSAPAPLSAPAPVAVPAPPAAPAFDPLAQLAAIVGRGDSAGKDAAGVDTNPSPLTSATPERDPLAEFLAQREADEAAAKRSSMAAAAPAAGSARLDRASFFEVDGAPVQPNAAALRQEGDFHRETMPAIARVPRAPATPEAESGFAAPAFVPSSREPAAELSPPVSPSAFAAVARPSVNAAASALRDPNDLLGAFCAGAGITLANGQHVDADFMQALGMLLRRAIEGTHRLMALRAANKQEMHAEVTMIRTRENNPLKFAPDAQSALEQLLQPPRRGFLGGAQAVDEAMDDLMGHAIGTMAGMRAALDGVLARFAPDQLEAKLVGRSVLDLVPMHRRAKLWELYLQHFDSVRADARDDFHALFGRAFLAAYEHELDRLYAQRHSGGSPDDRS